MIPWTVWIREAISIVYAMNHSGLAMVMTSTTTAGGLLSFISAKLPPIMSLGIFAAIGVMIALMFSLVLLPSLLVILPIKHKASSKTLNEPSTTWIDKCLKSVSSFAYRYPWFIVTGCILLTIISVMGASKLHFSHNTLSWFPEEHPLRQAVQTMDKQLKGSGTIEVLIDTQKENGLYSPEVMNRLQEIQDYAVTIQSQNISIASANSVVDILKKIHQSLNENHPDFYAVPQDREMIAQELLLFENSGTDDLEPWVDSQFSVARMTLKVPQADARYYNELLVQLEQKLQSTFQGYAKITITGSTTLVTTTMFNLIETMISSYLSAGIIITLLMIITMANVKIGLLSMIPNVLPVLVGLGVMGFLGIPLDVSTILVGSIAMGIAVDDTIHFMHHFQRYYQKTGEVQQAIQLTLNTSGRALIYTSIVLSLGFFVFMMASLSNISNFGLITGITILAALLSDLLIAPALVTLLYREQKIVTVDSTFSLSKPIA